MKIKNSKKEITIDNLHLLFFISAAVCTVLRCIQVSKLIDAETGFYKETSIITVLFYVFLFGSCLVFVLLSYLSRQSAAIQTSSVKSKPLCTVCAFFGVVMLFDSLGSLSASLGSSSSVGMETESAFKAMMASGSLPKALQAVFALVSAVYFFILASSFRDGGEKARRHKIMALAPVGWVAFRMIFRFVSKISFLRVSDLFLELCMLAFTALFFMAFAQVNSGVYSEGFGWRLPAFGLSAALIAFSSNVPRLIFTFVDSQKYINSSYTFSLVDLVFSIFAVMLIPAAVKASLLAASDDGIEPTDAEVEKKAE